jgi:hypothetical protein
MVLGSLIPFAFQLSIAIYYYATMQAVLVATALAFWSELRSGMDDV